MKLLAVPVARAANQQLAGAGGDGGDIDVSAESSSVSAYVHRFETEQ